MNWEVLDSLKKEKKNKFDMEKYGEGAVTELRRCINSMKEDFEMENCESVNDLNNSNVSAVSRSLSNELQQNTKQENEKELKEVLTEILKKLRALENKKKKRTSSTSSTYFYIIITTMLITAAISLFALNEAQSQNKERFHQFELNQQNQLRMLTEIRIRNQQRQLEILQEIRKHREKESPALEIKPEPRFAMVPYKNFDFLAQGKKTIVSIFGKLYDIFIRGPSSTSSTFYYYTYYLIYSIIIILGLIGLVGVVILFVQFDSKLAPLFSQASHAFSVSVRDAIFFKKGQKMTSNQFYIPYDSKVLSRGHHVDVGCGECANCPRKKRNT